MCTLLFVEFLFFFFSLADTFPSTSIEQKSPISAAEQMPIDFPPDNDGEDTDKWLAMKNNNVDTNVLTMIKNEIQNDEDIAIKSAFLLRLLEVEIFVFFFHLNRVDYMTLLFFVRMIRNHQQMVHCRLFTLKINQNHQLTWIFIQWTNELEDII